ACRVTVGGETKFACVDGPEFDGHKVDFEELVKRQRMFLPEERLSSLLWEKLGGRGCGGR
ncbi:sulfide/dihydroorotate dehydrogenase-like FAD/NAD-binding protein, partial [Candidatus Bathyarchaeota archaeon]